MIQGSEQRPFRHGPRPVWGRAAPLHRVFSVLGTHSRDPGTQVGEKSARVACRDITIEFNHVETQQRMQIHLHWVGHHVTTLRRFLAGTLRHLSMPYFCSPNASIAFPRARR